MVKIDAGFYVETACLGTAQGGEVGTTIQGTADVAGEGTDIGSLAANHTDAGGLLLVVIVGAGPKLV